MLNNNTKIKVGIIRGGEGNFYSSSLKKGGDIILHIHDNLQDTHKVFDILIDKKGIWYFNGMPIKPSDLRYKIDIVWNTSKHPRVSSILDDLSITKIDNGSFQNMLENSNTMLQKHIKNIDVKMPRFLVLPVYQKDIDGPLNKYVIKKAKEVFEKFSSPWIVKSFTPDSNMGIHLVKTFPELVDAIEDGIIHQKSILIEEFILGRVFSVHSVTGFRNQDIYVFPPKDFLAEEKEKIIKLVKDIHKHIDVKHYLKSDFILHAKKGFFLTNIELFPDLREGSHLEQSCKYVGADIHHISMHILEKALNK